VLNLHNVFI